MDLFLVVILGVCFIIFVVSSISFIDYGVTKKGILAVFFSISVISMCIAVWNYFGSQDPIIEKQTIGIIKSLDISNGNGPTIEFSSPTYVILRTERAPYFISKKRFYEVNTYIEKE